MRQNQKVRMVELAAKPAPENAPIQSDKMDLADRLEEVEKILDDTISATHAIRYRLGTPSKGTGIAVANQDKASTDVSIHQRVLIAREKACQLQELVRHLNETL